MSQQKPNILQLKDIIIDGRYKILKRKDDSTGRIKYFEIGRGSYGVVYKAIDIKTGKLYAVKAERESRNNLLHEKLIYEKLNSNEAVFMTSIHYYGNTENRNVLVCDLLGKNLEDIFMEHKSSFRRSEICTIGKQLVAQLEYIHRKGIVHRDLKPENILARIGSDLHDLVIIDYGLCKDASSKNVTGFWGTRTFASVNAHLAIEQSARDDLEAVAYILMYFINGGWLPWEYSNISNIQDRHVDIALKKRDVLFKKLWQNCPVELDEYLGYIRSLDSTTKPDYEFLFKLFIKLERGP